MNAKMNIKSIIAIMLIIIIASMLFVNISFATETGKVVVETAKIREERDTDSKVLELIAKDEKVEVLEEVDNWYKVKYKNITGYIRADLVQLDNKITNTTETENTVETVANVEEATKDIEETPTVETTGIEKYTVSENVKLKIIPLISSIELSEISKDTEVEIIENLNNWIKIKTSDGKQGWIIKEKTINGEKVSLITAKQVNSEENKEDEETEKVEETAENKEETTIQKEDTTKTMYANSQTVNVRQKADKSSQVVKQISINTQVTVISTENGWAYVDVSGTKGYIAENLLSTTKQETSRSATTDREKTTQTTQESAQETNESATEGATSGSAVVSYAQQFKGCKYVYGGTSPNGFDCSGFTQYVYKHFGINLNRTAASQYSNGTAVTDLQAGDLVMFGKSGINHVGIYIGGNTFVHAANKERGVTVDTLSSGYYKTNYVGARRIL